MKTTLLLSLFLVSVPLTAQSAQTRTTPPPPAAPRAVTIPQPVEKTLANGLRVIVIEKRGLPLAAARLMFRTGGEADPQGRGGLADLTGSLLTKGTKTRTAEQIARGVEALGATIESGASWDFSYLALSTLSTNFGPAMKFVADAAMNPTFQQEEIDRLRDQNIDALSVAMREPASLSAFVATRVLFGSAPYGHNLGGTPESLRAITRSDIVSFHTNYYRPDNAILVIAGNVDAPKVFASVSNLFANWKRPSSPLPSAPAAVAADSKPRVVVVDMPDAGQASVVVARRGIRRTDPAYFTAQVANMILGGDYSSRLNQEVRIKRGLSYGAGSSFDARRDVGPFTTSTLTKNESAVEVAGIVANEVARMGSAAPDAKELVPRKANLIGRFGRGVETMAGLVSRIGGLALYGLPIEEINRYVASVEAVTAEDVRTFSAGALASSQPDIVIVGDVKKFGPAFKEKYPDAEVIAVDALDLNSLTLRK